MDPHRTCWLIGLLTLVLAAGSAASQPAKPAKPKKPVDTFTDPAEAGPDFRIQGEYEGEAAGAGKLAAQVVARGDGKFDVYFLAGGLPGAGWDAKTRIKASAVTADGRTTVTGGGWSGTIADGRLTGTTPAGNAFALKQVVRRSPTLGVKPPAGAVVLFDGTSTDAWQGGTLVEGNLLNCGTRSKQAFGAGKYHVEFRTPFKPKASGQARGNSGVYLLGHEIQVLDSFGLTGEKNECGAFYGSARPAVNMCFPPLSWQTYDIEAHPGADGTMLVTVWHNGVKIHEDFPIKNAKPAPITLQNHGNPVVYRNIWFVPAGAKEQPAGN
jgi:hypothetical protein